MIKTSLALLTFVTLALASSSDMKLVRRQHSTIAHKRDTSAGTELSAREDGNSRWTWYNTETGHEGACGGLKLNTDFVVARAQVDFKQSDCGKSITLEWQGKSAQAVIWDICPGCPSNALDLSKGLFTHFASEDVGIINGNWKFNDGSSPPTPSTSTTSEAPKPTASVDTPAATPSLPNITGTECNLAIENGEMVFKCKNGDAKDVTGTGCNLTVENGEMVTRCSKYT
ncbi:hypothetical protein DFP72DRAFT_1066284 [Ephemerocybe angulata]|uniref:Uncharacterized protein n=1 Tax=Ephemerocybe angulata TaxID=980116 RepID=A0A8H6M6R9_9AGAR|nr:hypothetical protein DFP72DRAFT_1066284 [Tulosesus angulatus]